MLDIVTQKIKSYRGIRNLKRAGEKINYTEPQIEELRKCALDPIYFIENYVYVQSADGGEEQLLKLYDRQKDYVRAIHENKNVLFLVGRQSGKCIHINTKVTIRNKKTGEIKEITAGELYDAAKAKLSAAND